MQNGNSENSIENAVLPLEPYHSILHKSATTATAADSPDHRRLLL